ncbi:Malectin-like domain [Dillenia turbinata]|uniref:Malectin-like domain n=1 Tax=Dillenia turbinata TaxID=194707 RepID=A0AAN8YY23_9MAGN
MIFPDDQFNQNWQAFVDDNPTVESKSNITSSDFWNLPPTQVFDTAITTSRGKSLKIQWPPGSLPSSNYYISLYFQDNRSPSPFSWRVFDVSINIQNFFQGLNVTTSGLHVYSPQRPLSGITEIILIPKDGIPVGPIISAGEAYQIVSYGARTLTRDVVVMEELARSLNNPPSDWSGDPCLPQNNLRTGVTCSYSQLARVSTLKQSNWHQYLRIAARKYRNFDSPCQSVGIWRTTGSKDRFQNS